MSDFPKLKTGVVAQYPSDRCKQFFTSVHRFIDGLEQRFRTGTTPLKRWNVRYDLLDEEELNAMERFFVSHKGRFGSFSFTDPWDNIEYPDCSFDLDNFELQFLDQGRCVSIMAVRENR